MHTASRRRRRCLDLELGATACLRQFATPAITPTPAASHAAQHEWRRRRRRRVGFGATQRCRDAERRQDWRCHGRRRRRAYSLWRKQCRSQNGLTGARCGNVCHGSALRCVAWAYSVLVHTHTHTHTTRQQVHLVAARCCRVNVRQLSLRGWSRHTTLQPQGATAVRGARQPPPRHQLAVCGERRSGMAACASTRVCSEALVNTWAGTRSTNSGWVAPSVDHSAWTGSHHGSSNAKLKLRGRGTG